MSLTVSCTLALNVAVVAAAVCNRYQYVISEMPVSIMPTLDYYGYEHEDAITGALICRPPSKPL